MLIENRGMGANIDSTRQPRGIKVVNDQPADLTDRFSSGGSCTACGIYKKAPSYSGCGFPASHHGSHSGCGAPSYSGCGFPASHHGSHSGCGAPSYSGCGFPASHHGSHSGCGAPSYNGCGFPASHHHGSHSGCGWYIPNHSYSGC